MVVVELRSVNHRGLKVIVRSNDAAAPYESEISRMIHESIRRGTITVHVSVKPPPGNDLPKINIAAALAYASQLGQVAHGYVDLPVSRSTSPPSIELTRLLEMPGVLDVTDTSGVDDDEVRTATVALIRSGVDQAIEQFNEMRHYEAAAMATTLQIDLEIVQQCSAEIEKLAPLVIDRYRDRLTDKIKKVLAEHQIEAETVDLIREVQVFADRSDISEEITRLASHTALFTDVLDGKESSGGGEKSVAVGRKLDFIIQEMFRETNTIGSKAGNAEIAQHVVEMKCAIERMRELVQNLE